MKRFVIAGVVLALLAIGVPAHASSSAVYDPSSCIDTNRNGSCNDSKDIPLAQAFALSTSVSQGDLILQGYNVLPAGDDIVVSGDVKVSGTLKLNNMSEVSTIEPIGGNIIVNDNANITGGFEFDAYRGSITIGNNTHLTAGKGVATLHFQAGSTTYPSDPPRPLSLGTGTAMHAGGDYSEVFFQSTGHMTIASGQTFTAGNHGKFHVETTGNLLIDQFYGKGGYFNIQTTAGNITVSNSTIIQTYLNGDLRMISSPPPTGPWTLNLIHDTITYKQVDHHPLYIPDPTITP